MRIEPSVARPRLDQGPVPVTAELAEHPLRTSAGPQPGIVRVVIAVTADIREPRAVSRRRVAYVSLSPEARSAAEVAIARSAASRATPVGQAEQENVIRKLREEFPPLAIDPL
jgi:hypothetical protein